MKFEVLREGNVVRRPFSQPMGGCGGPRIICTNTGELVCSYMLQSKLGSNDFQVHTSRSRDSGKTWSDPAPAWPQLHNKKSNFCGISKAPNGDLFLFGSETVIDQPGESFWADENMGLKANVLVWGRSRDDGKTWSPPQRVTAPMVGAAEVPGPLCVTKSGRWIGVYAPYNVIGVKEQMDVNQLVAVYSDDEGKTWHRSQAMRFAQKESGAAEAWVVQLNDGRLLAVSMHVNHIRGDNVTDYGNKYAISNDLGTTWSPTMETGIVAHTNAATVRADGKVLFINVHRRPPDPIGIYLALVQPTDRNFGIQLNQRIWSAERAALKGDSTVHENWVDYNFGEPATAVLPDQTIVMVYWHRDNDYGKIGYVHVRLAE